MGEFKFTKMELFIFRQLIFPELLMTNFGLLELDKTEKKKYIEFRINFIGKKLN